MRTMTICHTFSCFPISLITETRVQDTQRPNCSEANDPQALAHMSSMLANFTRSCRAALAKYSQPILSLGPPPNIVPLFNFSDHWVRERLVMQDDRAIGGFSEHQIEPSEGGITWSGLTSHEVDKSRQRAVPKSDQKKNASNVGFVAWRADVEDLEWELSDCEGLQLRGRFCSKRKYVINIRNNTLLDEYRTDDLYQAFIHPYLPYALHVELEEDLPRGGNAVEGGNGQVAGAAAAAADSAGANADAAELPPLVDVRIPWGAFMLTWHGYIQKEISPPMHLDYITHIGLLLADGEDNSGPFRLELESLSGFNYDDHESVHDDHVRESLALNEKMGYADIHSA